MFKCGCGKISFEGSVKSLKIAVPQAQFNSITFMQIYEPTRQYLLGHLSPTLSTVTASMLSRWVVATCSIPFESLRVRISNRVKDSKVNFVGYRVTLTRDMLYSAVFWSSF